MTAASLYPNRRLALGASLATFATVTGQRVATPTHGSMQVYVALLAPTAGGKQQPIDCGKEALREAGCADRIGSGDFRSSVALVNSLRVQSVFCSFIDEYGLVLQRLCNKGAGAYEQDLISVAQQLWGLNWTFYNSPASARQKSKQIFAPQFSILGVSIPQQFYRAVSSKEASGGFLNRAAAPMPPKRDVNIRHVSREIIGRDPPRLIFAEQLGRADCPHLSKFPKKYTHFAQNGHKQINKNCK
jgi:hypothetical protein